MGAAGPAARRHEQPVGGASRARDSTKPEVRTVMPQPTTYAMFFGPDKVPFVLGPQATVHCALATPFHGIVSRGLLQVVAERDEGPDVWHRHAHRLLDEPGGSKDSDAAALTAAARRCRVLSFGQSALAARTYVERYCATQLNDGISSCELWNIKEGHTSSVWQVTIDPAPVADRHAFILNVARDSGAADELERASKKMQAIGAIAPGANVAGVSDITTVRLDYFGEPLDVLVTRNELVADAYEVHCARDRHTGADALVLVDRFLTSDDRPARISSIRGRRLTADDCRQIANDIAAFLSEAARHDIEASVDINDGDVVWNGRRATVVAIR